MYDIVQSSPCRREGYCINKLDMIERPMPMRPLLPRALYKCIYIDFWPCPPCSLAWLVVDENFS